MQFVTTSGHRKGKTVQNARDFVKHVSTKGIGVIVGGALGWDTLVIEQCYKQGVPYIIHFAFGYQKRAMPQHLIDGAIEILIEKEEYTGRQDNWVFHERDQKMVDRGTELHIYWDGRTTGGTYKTLRYAQSKNIPYENWYPDSYRWGHF